ncbi:hypothetical protein SIO70_26420 [Chitinophaga sancti]|uniref:hypothetical protein n=1 Tax=Chitinophaga sancti TaxID=1004 RepID=UPI002A752ED0|nr:hypothetical protein [Chitinophaga sancti]WPQ61901.1 hypothetical protein SIO70_26420 [Chitinophaga sancti]
MTEGKNFSQQEIAFIHLRIRSEFSSFIYERVLNGASPATCLNFWEKLLRQNFCIEVVASNIKAQIPNRHDLMHLFYELYEKWVKVTLPEVIDGALKTEIQYRSDSQKSLLPKELTFDQQERMVTKYGKMEQGCLTFRLSKHVDVDRLNKMLEEAGMLYHDLMNMFMMLVFKINLDEYRYDKSFYTWLAPALISKVNSYSDLEMGNDDMTGGYFIALKGKLIILRQIEKMLHSLPGRKPSTCWEKLLAKLQFASFFIPMSATFKAIEFTAIEQSNFYEKYLPFADQVLINSISKTELLRIK